MKITEFTSKKAGICVKALDGSYSFLPNPLPPDFDIQSIDSFLCSEAHRLLGELSGIGRNLSNPYLLINPYRRKEAVASSRIEGTYADIKDLIQYEALMESSNITDERTADVREVSNYISAMENGFEELKNTPISTRLIKKIHGILMRDTRGKDRMPGNFRRTQVFIGPTDHIEDATFIPPNHLELDRLLTDWEVYLNKSTNEPPLVKTAILHYQFEAIHPFLDGNGRIGRLLIAFYLCGMGFLSEPLLYISTFFEKNRLEYYDRLLAVSQKGDWKGWTEFFLKGVVETSEKALVEARDILDLHIRYKKKLLENKANNNALRLLDEIFNRPAATIPMIAKKWNTNYNIVKRAFDKLIEMGILHGQGDFRQKPQLFWCGVLFKIMIRKDNFKK